mmetsp:Transcript_3859/g.15959  ORF Transcript_3859/g.15959 Transcript_3859/m.15959 type:complete len:203 (+) Transcript_3859:3112-3720(+)
MQRWLALQPRPRPVLALPSRVCLRRPKQRAFRLPGRDVRADERHSCQLHRVRGRRSLPGGCVRAAALPSWLFRPRRVGGMPGLSGWQVVPGADGCPNAVPARGVLADKGARRQPVVGSDLHPVPGWLRVPKQGSVPSRMRVWVLLCWEPDCLPALPGGPLLPHAGARPSPLPDRQCCVPDGPRVVSQRPLCLPALPAGVDVP